MVQGLWCNQQRVGIIIRIKYTPPESSSDLFRQFLNSRLRAIRVQLLKDKSGV